jgi:hypothetical protein
MTGAARRRLASLATGVRTAWLICGVTLLLILCLEFAYRGYEWARITARRLPRPADYSVGAGSAEAFRNEMNAAWHGAAWAPYVHWVTTPFSGRLVSVDSAHRRRTIPTPQRPAHRVFLLGGSTMWGIGAQDRQTIASHLAAQLAEAGRPDVAVVNHAQIGWVQTQELIGLTLALRAGERPDLVLFYDGINDVIALAQAGMPGVPQNERHREHEFRYGRAMRGTSDFAALAAVFGGVVRRSHVARRLAYTRPPGDSAAAQRLAAAQAATCAANADIADALGARYGFAVLYVWQPALESTTKPLSGHERAMIDGLATEPLFAARREINRRMPALLAATMQPRRSRYLDLTRLFDGDTTMVFFDAIGHTTEAANARIAAALLPAVLAHLPPARTGN